MDFWKFWAKLYVFVFLALCVATTVVGLQLNLAPDRIVTNIITLTPITILLWAALPLIFYSLIFVYTSIFGGKGGSG
jgi:hypothetical protein